jgi:hypothetical protein
MVTSSLFSSDDDCYVWDLSAAAWMVVYTGTRSAYYILEIDY